MICNYSQFVHKSTFLGKKCRNRQKVLKVKGLLGNGYFTTLSLELIKKINFMAKQKSIFRLKGNIGGVSFYKSQDGFLAREQSSVDPSRIFHDAAFQRTRENMAEFGDAAKSGGLLRSALRPQLMRTADGRVAGRLTGKMMQILKTDMESPRGERRVALGAPQMLEGFDFNIKAPLGSTLYALYLVQINRTAGEASIHLPSFIPEEGVAMPEGSTHFKLISSCAIIDFAARDFEASFEESALIPLSSPATEIIDLQHTLSAGTVLPLFLTLGVLFYQQVNGVAYTLKNGVYNALNVVKVG